MTISRAPRGIPTGGQFTANKLSEPSISLDRRSAYDPGHSGSQPPGLRGPRKIAGEWVPEDQVEHDREGGTFSRREAAEADEASGATASSSHNAPASEVKGSFVGWAQIVPKFLRR